MKIVSLALAALALAACAASPAKRNISSEAVKLGPTVRHDATSFRYCPKSRKGEVFRMSQMNAEKYCAEQGLHLPTAREFGLFSMGFGAKGILEVSSAEEKAPAGYYRVDSINPGDLRDDLHFSHEGYDAVAGNLGNDQFWTSSVVPQNKEFAHVFYGAWGGGGGEPKEHHRKFPNAVRCVM